MNSELFLPPKTLYRRTLNKLKRVPLIQVLYKNLNPLRKIEIASIQSYLTKNSDDYILDIGCGDGYWTNYFSKSAKKIIGIDPNKEDVEIAKKRAKQNVVIMTGQAEHLEFADTTFDKVVSVCVFEHLLSDINSFKEIYRVLKKNGKLLATVDSLNAPNISNEHIKWHLKQCYCNQLYDEKSISEKLASVGFTDIKIKYISCSKLSIKWEIFNEQYGILSFCFVPVMYPLIRLVEMNISKNYGYKLFVKAEKI